MPPNINEFLCDFINCQNICYSWSLFCFLLITEGVQSRHQRNSSFAFRNHLFAIPTIFEKNFSNLYFVVLESTLFFYTLEPSSNEHKNKKNHRVILVPGYPGLGPEQGNTILIDFLSRFFLLGWKLKVFEVKIQHINSLMNQ